MGTGAHLRIRERGPFPEGSVVRVCGSVCVCGECHGVLNDVFLRCVFERHDVKSHDYCSKEAAFDGNRKPPACGPKHSVSSSSSASIFEALRDSQILGSDRVKTSLVCVEKKGEQ